MNSQNSIRHSSFVILLLCSLLFALSAHAQKEGTYSGLSPVSNSAYTQTLDGGTNVIAGNTTNNTTFLIKAPGAEYCVLYSQFRLHSGAGTTNIVLQIVRCAAADGTACETNTPFVPWALAANGTNFVSGITNFALNGCPALKIITTGNGNAQIVTNLNVSYGARW